MLCQVNSALFIGRPELPGSLCRLCTDLTPAALAARGWTLQGWRAETSLLGTFAKDSSLLRLMAFRQNTGHACGSSRFSPTARAIENTDLRNINHLPIYIYTQVKWNSDNKKSKMSRIFRPRSSSGGILIAYIQVKDISYTLFLSFIKSMFSAHLCVINSETGIADSGNCFNRLLSCCFGWWWRWCYCCCCCCCFGGLLFYFLVFIVVVAAAVVAAAMAAAFFFFFFFLFSFAFFFFCWKHGCLRMEMASC